jgi:UDP-3-O-[3-hydroxymyristoyl] N-acetylglucosamine deacetylase
VQRIGFRQQRTLRSPIAVRGVGIVGGQPVRLRFVPAPVDTGLVFVRTDLNHKPTTPANADRVTDTTRRTTLGMPQTGVTLVEHVLSALAGLRIDNCLIELDSNEPPGLDGSATGFTEAIYRAGIQSQSTRRAIYATETPLSITQHGATITLYPPKSNDICALHATYILDYGARSPIARQTFSMPVNPTTFERNVANCRTFLLEQEVDLLRSQGIGSHMTPADILVFGHQGVIGNHLRHADEPARHKILDLIGDLALCGSDLAGHVVAYRSGHALNVALAKTLADNIAAAEDDVLPTRVTLSQRQRAA